MIAESLWDHLKENTTQFHQRIVELFLQLHNLTPSPSLCANVIGNSLVDISKVNKTTYLPRGLRFACYFILSFNSSEGINHHSCQLIAVIGRSRYRTFRYSSFTLVSYFFIGSFFAGSLEVRCVLACSQEYRHSGFWKILKTRGVSNP